MTPKKEVKLEDMKVYELEKLYYLMKLQNLRKVGQGFLPDVDHFSDSEKLVPLEKTIVPVALVDFASGEINVPQMFDGDAFKTVSAGVQHTSAAGLGTSDATVSITAGEIWEILAIFATFNCDATVADRTASLLVTPQTAAMVAAVPAAGNIPFDDITLSASQTGGFFITQSGLVWLNDNGTTGADATVTTTPLPMILQSVTGALSSIAADITANGQAGDTVALDVWYRKVNRA
jgi:hypothetical protein